MSRLRSRERGSTCMRSLPVNRRRRFSPRGEHEFFPKIVDAQFSALRRNIRELQLGQPNYEMMSANLADATRQQLPQLKTIMDQLGALQTVTFKGVGPGGADIYEVKFEHGSTE